MTEIFVETHPEQWGARYKGALPSTSGQLIQVLSNPAIAGDPVPMAVHLFRPDRQLPTVGENGDARAKITYATGAAENSFRCDWDAQFSLVCSRITIELESYAPLSEDVEPYAATSREVIFGALIGRGACPSGGSDAVAFTSEGVLLPASLTMIYEIPDFARRYYPVLAKDPSGGGSELSGAEIAAITIAFLNQATTRLVVVTLTPEILARGIPIPGGLARVAVTNSNGPGNDMHLIHHFKLGL